VLQPLLILRLLIIDSCNQLPDVDQVRTADAWVDILELEASRLIDGGATCLPARAGHQTMLWRRYADKWARMLGHADPGSRSSSPTSSWRRSSGAPGRGRYHAGPANN
jgi:hypothetical protein